jgi:hypothetical protein
MVIFGTGGVEPLSDSIPLICRQPPSDASYRPAAGRHENREKPPDPFSFTISSDLPAHFPVNLRRAGMKKEDQGKRPRDGNPALFFCE